MGWLSALRSQAQPRARAAAFAAAEIGRLTASFSTDPGAINRWLRYELRTMRARARQLARGDAYAAKFLHACVTNIAGPRPFVLQSKVKFQTGGMNDTANQAIEKSYREWSRPGGCEVTGKLSLGELDRLVVRCLARDGEALIRKVQTDRRSPLKLQLLDIDRLDELRNGNMGDGGAIKLGVEVDRWGAPRAYHLLKNHPGEVGEWGRGGEREHEVVPADEIWHLFTPDWPEQVRGFPWLHAAMIRLWNLGGFEEAAVIAARVGAMQMGFITTESGDPPPLAQGTDPATGAPVIHGEPAAFPVLPSGSSITAWNPKYPDAAVGPFVGICLRGAAAAVNMAYHNFGNDLEGVNFTSGRLGERDERDHWMSLQNWYIEHFCEPRTSEWLRVQNLRGVFPEGYMSYRDQLIVQGKRWPHIQPREETESSVTKIDNGLTSPQQVITDAGGDPEDVVDDLAAWQEMLKAKGVELPAKDNPAPAPAPKPAADDDDTATGAEGAQPSRLYQ